MAKTVVVAVDGQVAVVGEQEARRVVRDAREARAGEQRQVDDAGGVEVAAGAEADEAVARDCRRQRRRRGRRRCREARSRIIAEAGAPNASSGSRSAVTSVTAGRPARPVAPNERSMNASS